MYLSFLTFSIIKRLTLSPVSNPIKSVNLKLAVFGLPIKEPVMASISSILNLYFSVSKVISVPDITPIRFPINAGVSLHKTVCLPKVIFPKSIKNSATSGKVFSVGIISSNLRYLAGLKKCVPQK